MKTTKSPRKVLREGLEVARQALAAYGHRFSPHKFTQHQLFAVLVLKEFQRCDYRKVVDLLKDCSDLRREIGLESVPHFTTLQKASARLLVLGNVRRLLKATVDRARKKSSSANG
jgi:hypothetical protein